MHYEGKMYRPWPEANSLLIQATLGCTNKRDGSGQGGRYRDLAFFHLVAGGRERSKEHIVETTKLLNLMEPEELAPMALAIQPGTELERQVETGEFVLPTTLQVLVEERYLLENLGDFEMVYWGDHGNNVTPLPGCLPESREQFLRQIQRAMDTHSATPREVLQTFAW